MKYSLVTVAAVGMQAAAVAGKLDPKDFFPACAVNCITSVLSTATTCAEGDDICLCTRDNQYKVYYAAEQCVIDACGFDVAQQTALPAAKPYCEAATAAYSLTATSPLPTPTPRVRSTSSSAPAAPTTTSTRKLVRADYFPDCSLNCITGVLGTVTTCDPEDDVCLCTRANQYKIYEASEECVIAACGFDVAQQSVLAAAQPYCSAATSLYSLTATSPLPTETPRVRSSTPTPQVSTSATVTGSSASGAKNSTTVATSKASLVTKTTQATGAVTTKPATGAIITKTTVVIVTEPCTDASGSTTGYTTKTVPVTRTETCHSCVAAPPTKAPNCETCKVSAPVTLGTPVVVKTETAVQTQGTAAPSKPAVVVNGAGQVGPMGVAALLALGLAL